VPSDNLQSFPVVKSSSHFRLFRGVESTEKENQGGPIWAPLNPVFFTGSKGVQSGTISLPGPLGPSRNSSTGRVCGATGEGSGEGGCAGPLDPGTGIRPL